MQKVIEIPELSFPSSSSKCLSGEMVYITEWDKFVERSIELFRADPDSVISYFMVFHFM